MAAFDCDCLPKCDCRMWKCKICNPEPRLPFKSDIGTTNEMVTMKSELGRAMDALGKEHNERMELQRVLEKIVKWELPDTGEFADEERTRPISYGFLHGINGECEYFRKMAADVLDT